MPEPKQPPTVISQLDAEQKRGLAEASRIVSEADGVPLNRALELLQKDPGRLKVIGQRILATAERLEQIGKGQGPRETALPDALAP